MRTVHRFGYAFVGDAVDDVGQAGTERAGGGPETGCALLWGERIIRFPRVRTSWAATRDAR